LRGGEEAGGKLPAGVLVLVGLGARVGRGGADGREDGEEAGELHGGGCMACLVSTE
jgi:hypothetical protein